MALLLRETFATKAEAEVAAKVCEAEGLYHSRCLRAPYYAVAVQSPNDIEWIQCKDSGSDIPYIKRADMALGSPDAVGRAHACCHRQ
jgi:hypothetical protein